MQTLEVTTAYSGESRGARLLLMRALNILLVLTLWLSPVVQAYARTLSQAHCRAQNHISLTAPNIAQDAMHAAHHGQPSADIPAPHDGHGTLDADQCKCGCLCGHAGVISAVILPSFLFAEAPLPEHFDVVSEAAPPHAEHPALQRPPAVLS